MSDRRGGRRDEQAEHEERAHGPERRHDGERQQGEHRDVGEAGAQPERGGLVAPARQGEERPVPEHDTGERDDEGDRLQAQLRRPHGEDVAEQEGREVAGVRGLAADDHDTDREHPDEQQADARVLRQARRAVDEVDPADHHDGADDRPEREVEAPDGGEGDAGQHAVGEGVAEEREAAHDDPGADQRGRRGREETAQQRPPGEVRREGVEHEIDHDRARAISSASVRSIPT